MKTLPRKLITIAASEWDRETLTQDLERLGILGHTVVRAEGLGTHGHRPDTWQEANVVIEVVTTPEKVEQVLELLEKRLSPNRPLVAWISDVQAWPPAKFERY